MPFVAPGVGVTDEDAEVVGSVDFVGLADSLAGVDDDDVLGEAATSEVESPRPKISQRSANNITIIASKTKARRTQ